MSLYPIRSSWGVRLPVMKEHMVSPSGQSLPESKTNLSIGDSQKLEMEDLSGTNVEHWILSWHIGLVDVNESSPPSPIQSDDDILDAKIDEEQLHLTGVLAYPTVDTLLNVVFQTLQSSFHRKLMSR